MKVNCLDSMWLWAVQAAKKLKGEDQVDRAVLWKPKSLRENRKVCGILDGWK